MPFPIFGRNIPITPGYIGKIVLLMRWRLTGKDCPVIVFRQIMICLMKSEIRVEVPTDCRLVGVKTDGDVAIIIYEPIQNIRQIGFIQYPEPTDDNDEPDDKN